MIVLINLFFTPGLTCNIFSKFTFANILILKPFHKNKNITCNIHHNNNTTNYFDITFISKYILYHFIYNYRFTEDKINVKKHTNSDH